MSRLGRNELMRQAVHLGSGSMAFLVVWWGTPGTVLLAASATIFNIWILPRVGPALLRPREGDGMDVGIVSYPLAVLLLALLFHRHPEVVAAAWGVLAFGDGTATLVGLGIGRRSLPWNREKSWLGSSCYWLFGTLAASLLVLWTSSAARDARFVWITCAVVVFASALLESLPVGLDDNLSVPLLTALGLLLLLETEGAWSSVASSTAEGWVWAVMINVIVGAAAYLMRGVNTAGLLSGMVVGTVIYLTLGPPGYAVLAAFYVLGTAATRLGFRRKIESGLAQGHGGRRSARNVLANAGVAAAAAVLAVASPEGDLLVAGFVAALAAATGDTLASEFGQLAAGRTRLVTTFELVAPGTDGGISPVGTVAGLLGSASIALLGWRLGLYPFHWSTTVALAAVVAVFIDSLLGATLERAGRLDNEAVNFAATLSGALMAYWLLRLSSA